MSELPKIITWAELKQVVPYTRQHVLRLENDGKFPRRVQIGANRVGWLLNEIEQWFASRIDQRDARSLARTLDPKQRGA